MALVETVIVTIDGPAGAGKSSVAHRLAKELGFDFLDTGAMYRCVTLAALRSSAEGDVTRADVAAVLQGLEIRLEGDLVFLNDQDVTQAIRAPEVTRSIRPIADNPSVRQKLVQLQRSWAAGRHCVTEGRDQGTVAFPNAACKIYLTASPEERARRRVAQLTDQKIPCSYEEILGQQNQRDREDMDRPVGPLKQADDALVVVTDGMSEDQVLEELLAIVRHAQSGRAPNSPNSASSPQGCRPHLIDAPRQRT
jgi:cytidylate kinase/pantoate ligase/cytidylate kinase